ncbi:MAG: hypothetical protein LBR80_17235 [Deltaproteobacteria bacterium]|jgi:hypothetical protein|nr:hypothetical protein [Deltaproteobacteria bacterium]
MTRIANGLGKGEDGFWEEISDYCDGFSFNGRMRLCNPFSPLRIFSDMRVFPENQFTNYWMKYGSNILLRKFLMDKALTPEQFQGMGVDRQFASDPVEMDGSTPT